MVFLAQKLILAKSKFNRETFCFHTSSPLDRACHDDASIQLASPL
jgi:hypothetical protein